MASPSAILGDILQLLRSGVLNGALPAAQLTPDQVAATQAAVAGGGISAGVYTPIYAGVANLTALVGYSAQYIRVQNVVTVSGKLDADPLAAAAETALTISLPIPSSFTAEEQCCGVSSALAVSGQVAAIRAETTNDLAEMRWISSDVGNRSMYFTFTYRIL